MPEKERPFSKLSLLFGAVVFLITVSAFVPARWFGSSPASYKNKPLDLTTITSPEEVAKDSNNDGVISWDEVVAESLSGESSSTLASLRSSSVDAKTVAELNDPNNLTSSLSKNLLIATTKLRQEGISDEETSRSVLNQLMQQEASKITHKTYSRADLSVAPNETKESLMVYGNGVANILASLISEKTLSDDSTQIASFVQTKDPSTLVPLLTRAKKIDALISKAEALSVPPSAVSQHILLLNRASLYRDDIVAFAHADSDPVRATLIVNEYPDAALSLFRIYNIYYTYFNIQNIVFSSKDPGYVFTIGYTMK
jgi:hypothetical protein